MFLYRVEKSEKGIISDGSEISSSGGYNSFLNSGDVQANNRLAVEDALIQSRVNPSVNRREALYLFHELKDALIFSSKMFSGNARIYIVDVPHGSMIGRYDMNVVDFINHAVERYEWLRNPETSECVEDLCDFYWKMSSTFTPCYEYLVRNAQVVKMICDLTDCVQFHREYSDSRVLSFRSCERCSIYVQKLNEL